MVSGMQVSLITGNSPNNHTHYSPLISGRKDPKATAEKGIRKAFLTGSNTSCRNHIRQHYSLYNQRCKEQNIPENFRAIPTAILKEMKEADKKDKSKKQTTLDAMMGDGKQPTAFTPEGLLEMVAKFVACDDQVSVSIATCRSELKKWYIVPGGCQQGAV
jgi:hypothetical protein